MLQTCLHFSAKIRRSNLYQIYTIQFALLRCRFFNVSKTEFDLQTVWTDGRVKNSPISPKVAKNVATTVFTLKVMPSKSPNSFLNIWATFTINIVAKYFQKNPIWSRCLRPPMSQVNVELTVPQPMPIFISLFTIKLAYFLNFETLCDGQIL